MVAQLVPVKGGVRAHQKHKRARKSQSHSPKDQMRERIGVARRTIENLLVDELGHLVYKKSIHRSKLFAGVKVSVAKPAAMSSERLVVRHIATTLLAQNPGMTEVQAAISHSSRTIYIASNSNQRYLEQQVGGRLQGLNMPNPAEYSGRVERHMTKLLMEMLGPYGSYKLTVITGLEGRHAETKIIDAKVDFDYIGGTRRPCLGCSIYMHQEGVDPSKFNPHSGAYWNSNRALLPFGRYLGDVRASIAAVLKRPGLRFNRHYVNEGLALSRVYDYDTDSEAEEDI
jgi:hypothetical protein